MQSEALVGDEWLSHPECQDPIILCGDFNALPRSRVYRNLTGILIDAQEKLPSHRPRPTWSSHYPLGRIDHIFVSSDFDVTQVIVPYSRLERISSDHLPLVVDVRVTAPSPADMIVLCYLNFLILNTALCSVFLKELVR